MRWYNLFHYLPAGRAFADTLGVYPNFKTYLSCSSTDAWVVQRCNTNKPEQLAALQ